MSPGGGAQPVEQLLSPEGVGGGAVAEAEMSASRGPPRGAAGFFRCGTVIVSKQVICTAKFKFTTLHVKKCPSRSSHLGNFEVRLGQVLPQWLYDYTHLGRVPRWAPVSYERSTPVGLSSRLTSVESRFDGICRISNSCFSYPP